MANYATLKAAINAVIRANGNKEITGTVLNETLTAMVNSLGANYQFAGVATPSTNPGTPDQNVFYLAGQAGTYTNFNSIVLPNGVSVLRWNGSWSSETVVAGDGVFDISTYKATGGTLATFADLSAALDGGNNIPQPLRKGGMSVKFVQSSVQSSDNKYVQYFLTKNSWSVSESDWEKMNLEEEVNQLGQDINVLSDSVNIGFFDITPDNKIVGYRITGDGNLVALDNNASVSVYNCKEGEKFHIEVHNQQAGAISTLLYCFYNNTETLDQTTKVTGREYIHDFDNDVVVPAGAKCLAIFAYSPQYIPTTKKFSSVSKEKERVDEIEEVLFPYDWSQITPDSTESGYRIRGTGNLEYLDGNANVYIYNCQEGDKFHIKVQNTAGGIATLLWAEYSGTPLSSDTFVGGRDYVASYDNDVIIPSGVTRFAVFSYSPNYIPVITKYMQVSELEMLENDISELENDLSNVADRVSNIEDSLLQNICVELSSDGNNLYIAYNNGDGVEITYWFKKCMANLLFTFYRVGYRLVTRTTPDTDGISTQTDIVNINETISDNIGPMETNNGPIGGNHHWPNETASPKYKTATCVSYDCFVNGKRIGNGEKLYSNEVIIKVVNTLFDGGGSRDEQNLILTTPLCTETVYYKVVKNSIEVSLNHTFVENPITTEIIWYSGMQSYFDSENKFSTPKGLYIGWNDVFNGASFKKEDYPSFNRFLEKSTTRGTYQSTYLLPVKLGTHQFVEEGTGYYSNIFNRADGKQYHWLITNKTIAEVGNHSWTGVYSFFHEPIADNETYLFYEGVCNGKDYLFLDIFSNYNGNIQVPIKYFGKKISIVEKTDSITFNQEFIDADGLSIVCANNGSLILQVNP